MGELKPYCNAWVCYQVEEHCPGCGVGQGIDDVKSLENLIEQTHSYYLNLEDSLCWDCENDRRKKEKSGK
jgi:7-cyano-7-deazaguanine synthase in queuosine biosynthesis